MYTLKIQTWKSGEQNIGFPKTLFIEGSRITQERYQRKEIDIGAGKMERGEMDDFAKDIYDELGLGEVHIYNPDGECDMAMSFAYFDNKNEYKAIVVFGDARVYLMNESGKTIDSFNL